MLEELLDTKVKIRIARLFAERPGMGGFHVSKVAELLNISKSRTSQCLKELEKGGLLAGRTVGRSLVYELSGTELSKSVMHTLMQDERLLLGIEKIAVEKIKKMGPSSIAVFGSSLGGLKAGSDVDILVLFEKNKKGGEQVHGISAELSEKFGVRVSILVMELGDFKKKARAGEEFVLNVLADHKLIYGRDPEELVWQGK